jgi:hypothetical protein
MTSPEEITETGKPGGESEKMEVDPGPEPKRPVRKRRILTDNLEGLDPRIADKAKKAARECVTELGRFKATGSDVSSKRLKVDKDEGTRVFYGEVVKQLDKTSSRKEKFIKARKKVRPDVDEDADGVNFGTVKGAINSHITKDKRVARPYGQQKGAASLEKGHVLALNPVIKIGSQTEQLLGRISQLFMNRVNDMEYESMLVNQRVFVSGNVQANVTKIAQLNMQDVLREAAKTIVADNAGSAQLREYSIGALAAALDSTDPLTTLTKQQERGAELLSELSVGHHVDASARKELQEVLKVLQNLIRTSQKVHGPLTPDAAAAAITDNALKNRVIAVMPPDDKSHAEQYLALALVKSGYSARAVISGTKNPCSCCWLTLTLVLQHGYDLRFNDTAGLYWPKAARGVKLVADALNVKDISQLMSYFKSANNLTNDQDRFLQHLTALKEVGLIVDVPAKGGGLADRGLTQDQTSRSVYMVNNPAFSTDKLPDDFAEYPGSPLYSYGSPLRDEDSDVEREETLMDTYDKEHSEWLEKQRKAEERRKAQETTKKPETGPPGSGGPPQ